MELFGRRRIFTSADKITDKNVIDEVNKALIEHSKNAQEEDYLSKYRRGNQPILSRSKQVRPEICNRVVENHADEIVTFKDGYFLTKPAFYVPIEDKMADKVKTLNEFLRRSGKQKIDNRIVDDFHTMGLGVIYVEAINDKKTPCKVFALDPRCAFVVYSLRPGNRPVMGINCVTIQKKVYVDVYTEDYIYHLSGGVTNDTEKLDARTSQVSAFDGAPRRNLLGLIPIVEYRYNAVNMAAFESVIPLLDAINNVQSNRIDGIEQFVQNLIVAVNVDFEEGTTANTIMEAGMIALKSVGENKADLKILAEELGQSETQVLVDYLYQQVLTICAMPSTTKGGSSTSDTGVATYLRDGWSQADTAARNTEDLFRASNEYFDEVFLKILEVNAGFKGIVPSDFDLMFSRNETANLLTKSQGALNLMQLGLSPELCLEKSGISNDPVQDVAISQKYIDKAWGMEEKEPEDLTDEERETRITDEAMNRLGL